MKWVIKHTSLTHSTLHNVLVSLHSLTIFKVSPLLTNMFCGCYFTWMFDLHCAEWCMSRVWYEKAERGNVSPCSTHLFSFRPVQTSMSLWHRTLFETQYAADISVIWMIWVICDLKPSAHTHIQNDFFSSLETCSSSNIC